MSNKSLDTHLVGEEASPLTPEQSKHHSFTTKIVHGFDYILLAAMLFGPPIAYVTYKFKPLPQQVQQTFDKTIEYFTSYPDPKSPQRPHS